MPVKTRSMLKLRSQQIVKEAGMPIKTAQVHEIVKHEFPNVSTSTNRLSKYLQADKEIIFDKKIKAWFKPKINPLFKED